MEIYSQKFDQALSLLVVEDDEDDYFLVSEYIEELFQKAEVTWAPSIEAARDEFHKDQYDLCFLDVNLAGASGVELLDYAQSVGFQSPIVMLTGMNDHHTDTIAAEKGAVDYIVKDEMNRGQIARSIRYALSRKEATEERLRRNRSESESEAKTRFLANLSHELRSPLSAILGFSELLLDSNLDPQPHDSVNIIHRNGLHLLSLLDDVMDIAKIESGRMEIECSEINFEKFLRTVAKSLSISAQKKGLYLNFECLVPLPTRIYSDLTRLRQVLINVINNAIKYTSTGGVTVAVAFEERSDTQRLNFTIADTGAGIDKADISDIFKPFSQLDDAKVHREGAGLGLAICQQLVRGMGGDIACESEVGKGSVFTFYVQIGLPNSATLKVFDLMEVEPAVINYADADDALWLADRYVLIADDLPDVRNFMRRFILQLGAKPLLARNGLEAVNMVRRNDELAAAFIDLQMPVMNGFQAAEMIRDMRPDLALFALTASADVNVHELAVKAGFDEACAKPITFKHLRSILVSAIKRQAASTDSKAQVKTADFDLSEAPTSGAHATAGLPQSSDGNALRVLIVDDDQDLLKIISKLTRLLGHTVATAASANEAADRLNSASYDLIILDRNLGDANADDVLSDLENRGISTPIVIASGEDAGRDLMRHAQVKDFLMKPISKQTLQATYDAFVAKRDQ